MTQAGPSRRTGRDPDADRHHGFTLIELLVVLVVIALGAALVSLAMPDNDRRALTRDAERLAALLEAARAQSRATGVPVRWQVTASGFVFEGLPAGAATRPHAWLDARTRALGSKTVWLGPDPIIAAQAIVLQQAGMQSPPVHVATDGLRPFAVSSPP